MIKYILVFGCLLIFIQCSSFRISEPKMTLASKVLSTYADSIQRTNMSTHTRASFSDAITLLISEGVIDSLLNSPLSKKHFSGYVITNNQYTIGEHEDIGFEVFELKKDSTLRRTWFDFVAWNPNKNAKRVAESSVVTPYIVEQWFNLDDGESLEHSSGFILFKIDKGVISRVKILLNPPEEVIGLLYFNGMKY